MKFRSLPVVAALAWAGLAHAGQAPLDIVGVTLGMSDNDARAAVEKYGASSSWVFVKSTYGNGKPAGFIAARKDKDGNYTEAIRVALSPAQSKTYYVGRQEIFPQQGRPLVSALKDALGKKYGSAFGEIKYSNQAGWVWAWSPDGAPPQKTSTPAFGGVTTGCMSSGTMGDGAFPGGDLFHSGIGASLPTLLVPGKGFKTSCGQFAESMYIAANENHDVVATMSSFVVDFKYLTDDLKALQDQAAQEKQKAADDAKKAATTNVKL